MSDLSEIIIQDAEQICSKVDLSELRNSTIIITGASGLIGGYFLACLKYFFLNVKLSAARIFAAIQSEVPRHLEGLIDYHNISIIKGDLTDDSFIREFPYADYIIHTAGYGQPGRFMEDPIKTIQLNTETTFRLFKKLKPNGKFLFLSTGEVYSGLQNPPFAESEIGTTTTTHPRSCYIEAKRCGEAICNAYRYKGISAKSARLALAYGPGTRPGDMRVINSFIQKALEGKIDLLDKGHAKRTYCYISDAIEIMWNILLNGREPIYNVGGFSKITIGDLARKIADYLNVPIYFPDTSETTVLGAPDDVFLDMTKVQTEFKKTEFISLDEGLRRTIEWQKILYATDTLPK